MSTQYEEFPIMTPAAQTAAVISLGYSIDRMDSVEISRKFRRQLAAFLLEAMRQAGLASTCVVQSDSILGKLIAIAANLHNPPPPPPTLAEAREAARQLGGANAQIVHAFLASLREGEKP